VPSQVDVQSQAPSVLTEVDDVDDDDDFDADHVDLELGTLADNEGGLRDTAFLLNDNASGSVKTQRSRRNLSPRPKLSRAELSRRQTWGRS
jgi:hypothetical protein